MRFRGGWSWWLAAWMVLGAAGGARGAAPVVAPTSPPSLTISVSAGDVTLPSGKSVPVAATRLTLDGPELRTFEAKADKAGNLPPAPADYAAYFDSWSPWPGQQNPIGLTPRYDETGTLILGGFFRAFREETVKVASADGTKPYQRDVDFKYNPEWGQIANLSGHMTGLIRASGEAALGHLDLVEVGAGGKVRVKKGGPSLACPILPEVDPGDVALAGIYVAPWRAKNNPFYDGTTTGLPAGTSEYAVTEHEILPIHPTEPVAPIHPERLAKTLAKLRAGQSVKIAFMGASITVGAEATLWWGPDPYGPNGKTFRGRLIYGLRQRFPQAHIDVVESFKGATTVDYALQELNRTVLPQKPDLVVVDFGANDMAGPVGGAPNKPVGDYKQGMTSLLQQIRATGAEAIVILPEAVNPWLENHQFQRQPEYAKAAGEAADEQGAAVADFYAAFTGLNARGIPFWSQLHNWNNHPGNLGHEVYGDLLLRFFPVVPAAAETAATGDTSADGVVFGLAQPEAPTGPWEPGAQNLPPLDQIVAQPAPERPVYGVYCWADEYVKFHDFIRQVGWTTVRMGGAMTDAAMKLCAQDDIEVMACLGNQPEPALGPGLSPGNRAKFPTDDAFIAAYQQQLQAFLTRWGPGGSFFQENPGVPNHPVQHVEIWNEPNFFYLDQPHWMPAKDNAQRLAWDDARQKLYAKVLPAAHDAIKSKWPAVQVVGFAAGGAAHADTHFIAMVHADNPQVAASYDILSTHPYTTGGPLEEISVAPFGNFSAANSLREIRDTMDKAGAGARPVWYSELNWEITSEAGGRYPNNSRDQNGGHKQFSQAIQAANLVTGYAWTLRLGVKRLTYMSIVDTDGCNSGLMNWDGTWRLSAHVVQTMIETMPRPALRGAISDGDDATYIYRFAPDYNDASGHEVVMAWRATGAKTVEIPWADPQVAVVDMLGSRQVFPVTNGKLRIRIGPCPLYLTAAK